MLIQLIPTLEWPLTNHMLATVTELETPAKLSLQVVSFTIP